MEHKTTGDVMWYYTEWTSGTLLFDPYKMISTGVKTDALYVTDNAVYDGNLNRIQ